MERSQKQFEPARFPVTAATHWEHVPGKPQMYVADVPRKRRNADGAMVAKPGYADWEYTADSSRAMRLTRYWWRRFRSDMLHCGHCAHAWEV